MSYYLVNSVQKGQELVWNMVLALESDASFECSSEL